MARPTIWASLGSDVIEETRQRLIMYGWDTAGGRTVSSLLFGGRILLWIEVPFGVSVRSWGIYCPSDYKVCF